MLKVPKDSKVLLEILVLLAYPVILEELDSLVLLDPVEARDRPVYKVLLVLLAHLDH